MIKKVLVFMCGFVVVIVLSALYRVYWKTVPPQVYGRETPFIVPALKTVATSTTSTSTEEEHATSTRTQH